MFVILDKCKENESEMTSNESQLNLDIRNTKTSEASILIINITFYFDPVMQKNF